MTPSSPRRSWPDSRDNSKICLTGTRKQNHEIIQGNRCHFSTVFVETDLTRSLLYNTAVYSTLQYSTVIERNCFKVWKLFFICRSDVKRAVFPCNSCASGPSPVWWQAYVWVNYATSSWSRRCAIKTHVFENRLYSFFLSQSRRKLFH